jgi:hypothetical protein
LRALAAAHRRQAQEQVEQALREIIARST